MKNKLYLILITGMFFCVHSATLYADDMSETKSVINSQVIIPPADELSGGFKLCLPCDYGSIKDGWRYEIRYIYNSWGASLNDYINLFVARHGNKFILCIKDPALNDAAFRLLSVDEKITASVVTKILDEEMAQILKNTWVKVLLTAKYAYSRSIADGDFYYISSYVEDVGYLCASTIQIRKNTSSEDTFQIAKLLLSFSREKDEKRSNNLRTKILDICKRINDRFKPTTH